MLNFFKKKIINFCSINLAQLIAAIAKRFAYLDNRGRIVYVSVESLPN